MAASNRHARKKPAAGGSQPNRRANARSRALKAATRSATYQPKAEREPITIPLTWVKVAIGLLLTPIALVTAMAFLDAFAVAARDHDMWRHGEFWFFGVGVVMWGFAYAMAPRPLWMYVLGHELTHAFFILLFGGKVERFSVSRRGGYVVTDRTNVLITLSPYIIPFYTVLVLVAFGVMALFVDISRLHHDVIYGIADFKWEWLLFGLIGLTWGFHLTFTVSMIARDQPDLQEHGVFFSLVFIFLLNLVIITIGLVAACPETSFRNVGEHWLTNAGQLVLWVRHVASTLM